MFGTKSRSRSGSSFDGENITMFQAFEWYLPSDQNHWRWLRGEIPKLKAIGIDTVWIPPGCKAGSPQSNGYDVYDLYDLGEFEQKASRGTKWGTIEELRELIESARREGMGVLWDVVLNHKAHADGEEVARAVQVDPQGMFSLHLRSRKEINIPYEIQSWTRFDFPGRGSQYSDMKYNWKHFTGIDYDARTHTKGVFKFVSDGKKGWAEDVSRELGNYDYLMFADVDYTVSTVRSDVLAWGEWLGTQLPISGMRLDAIKHYSEEFLHAFISHLDKTVGKDYFFVGEYFTSNSEYLSRLIRRFQGRISLFDFQLVYNLSEASRKRQYDLRKVFAGTLVQRSPRNAVTFVQNHDTQETCSLAAPVEAWFIPHAYALILLRANAGYPCVFFGELYGICGPRPRPPAAEGKLVKLILARKQLAYGFQKEYFDDPACIGWTRVGKAGGKAGGLAVVMTNARNRAHKRMFVGKEHRGEKRVDLMGWSKGEVVIDGKGLGAFSVRGMECAVWVSAENAVAMDSKL